MSPYWSEYLITRSWGWITLGLTLQLIVLTWTPRPKWTRWSFQNTHFGNLQTTWEYLITQGWGWVTLTMPRRFSDPCSYALVVIILRKSQKWKKLPDEINISRADGEWPWPCHGGPNALRPPLLTYFCVDITQNKPGIWKNYWLEKRPFNCQSHATQNCPWSAKKITR